jgi:3'-5' exonuclease
MFFIFDVETVPDVDLIRKILAQPELDEEALMALAAEDLARGSSDFLPPMYHRMVSWVGPMG